MLTLPDDRFLILGHRGASADAPENTVEAFLLAAEQRADGVELDVRRTGEGALIVHHDAAVEGLGPIIAHTVADIRQHQPTIVTFDEAMAACEGLIVNVEIKNAPMEPDFDPDDLVAASVVSWLHDHGWTDQVIVSSFNPATVDRVRQLSGDLATGQLTLPGADAGQHLLTAHQRGHRALHPHTTSLADSEQLASIAAGLGLWLFAWTVDDPSTIRALRAAGVNGIITNHPDRALAALG